MGEKAKVGPLPSRDACSGGETSTVEVRGSLGLGAQAHGVCTSLWVNVTDLTGQAWRGRGPPSPVDTGDLKPGQARAIRGAWPPAGGRSLAAQD